ncbi:MAG: cysteine desulfurase family protein [Anaerovoracaceae bacterium]|nr:cysteine desulfurase [Clostridiales bacterium]
MIYLDNAATTKPSSFVITNIKTITKEYFGNPSSLHSLGMKSEKAIREAREEISSALFVTPKEVYFNSSGTEGNNSVIFGLAGKKINKGKRIITTKVEHPSVLEPLKYLKEQGFDIVYLDVDENGLLKDEVTEFVTEDTFLVSIMQVNNETGAIFFVDDISKGVKGINKNTYVHNDCIQGFLKIPSPREADFITISSHKVGGLKGTGALVIKEKIPLLPLVYGGGQEKGFRSGTENVTGIIAFDLSVKEGKNTFYNNRTQVQEMKEYLYKGFIEEVKDVKLNGLMDIDKFSPYIMNVSFLGAKAEVVLHILEEKGIYVSTGSACSSNFKDKSHVLLSMGRSVEEVDSAIRFSFFQPLSLEKLDYVIEEVKRAVKGIRSKTLSVRG